MSAFTSIAARLRSFALSLPEATEHFPWGERVVKVRGKVFVFLGHDATVEQEVGMSVKLPASRDAALESGFGTPTGYGLGKSGWVTLDYKAGDRPDVEQLCRWIEESYRAVAPKKVVAELDRVRA
jgi:predicted DNA-binding protein (MmcQ/YjbR family)